MREQQYPAYQLGLFGQGVQGMQPLVGQTSTSESTAGPMGVLGGIAGLGSSLALGGINPFSGLFSAGKPGQSVARQLGYDLSNPESLFGI